MAMHRNARQPVVTGKRFANRLRLGVPAGLLLTHRTHRCLIEDISASGALLRVSEPIPAGRTAMLQFHLLKLYVTIKWCRGGRCGVQFEQKLDAEDMEGFLWIVRHPKAYARFCSESGGRDWSMGLGG